MYGLGRRDGITCVWTGREKDREEVKHVTITCLLVKVGGNSRRSLRQ